MVDYTASLFSAIRAAQKSAAACAASLGFQSQEAASVCGAYADAAHCARRALKVRSRRRARIWRKRAYEAAQAAQMWSPHTWDSPADPYRCLPHRSLLPLAIWVGADTPDWAL